MKNVFHCPAGCLDSNRDFRAGRRVIGVRETTLAGHRVISFFSGANNSPMAGCWLVINLFLLKRASDSAQGRWARGGRSAQAAFNELYRSGCLSGGPLVRSAHAVFEVRGIVSQGLCFRLQELRHLLFRREPVPHVSSFTPRWRDPPKKGVVGAKRRSSARSSASLRAASARAAARSAASRSSLEIATQVIGCGTAASNLSAETDCAGVFSGGGATRTNRSSLRYQTFTSRVMSHRDGSRVLRDDAGHWTPTTTSRSRPARQAATCDRFCDDYVRPFLKRSIDAAWRLYKSDCSTADSSPSAQRLLTEAIIYSPLTTLTEAADNSPGTALAEKNRNRSRFRPLVPREVENNPEPT